VTPSVAAPGDTNPSNATAVIAREAAALSDVKSVYPDYIRVSC